MDAIKDTHGDKAVCSQCGKPLVFIGDGWRHEGKAQPRHPACPKRQPVEDDSRTPMSRLNKVGADVDMGLPLFTADLAYLLRIARAAAWHRQVSLKAATYKGGDLSGDGAFYDVLQLGQELIEAEQELDAALEA